MTAGYFCVHTCKRNFNSERGLARHQSACKLALALWQHEAAEAALFREKAAKMRELRLQCEAGTEDSSPVALKETLVAAASRDTIQTQETSQQAISSSIRANPLVPLVSASANSSDNLNTEPGAEPVVSLLGRGLRKKRKPRWLRDALPDPPAPVAEELPVLAMPRRVTATDSMPLHERHMTAASVCRTEVNFFGLLREFVSRPSYDPDGCLTADDLANYSIAPQASCITPYSIPMVRSQAPAPSWYFPFPNPSICRLMAWFWMGTAKKSLSDLDSLVKSVILADDFKTSDLHNFNIKKENSNLDKYKNPTYGIPALQELDSTSSETVTRSEASTSELNEKDGWREVNVKIVLPDGNRYSSENEAPSFTVPGLHIRSLAAVIQSVFQSSDALKFHYTPFKRFWRSTPSQGNRTTESPIGKCSDKASKKRRRDSEDMLSMSSDSGEHFSRTEQRIYDELYSSDIWIKEHAALQEQREEAGDEIEYSIAGLMLWSDSTHLADFGNAALWPIYLYFGNQSKYERARPSSNACHHLAYIPSLPDTITDAFKNRTGKVPSADILTHCRRELMHAILALILDEEFMDAYRKGILIKCADGICRRIFPRLLTYSADYPEKVLLSSIRSLGRCPCPLCLVLKSDAHKLGMKGHEKQLVENARTDSLARKSAINTARRFIYQDGLGVKSAKVERILEPASLVPIRNAFSERLFSLGVNFYMLFMVDLLHEFELGVWKQVFIHLIRLLTALGPDAVATLNERFRAVPTFGRAVIRKFCNNASGMKKLAARDFEDLLQCSLPVFEGLLPEPHNTTVLDLIFTLATWHALAKLRMHTDDTLALLEAATRSLGSHLRHFQSTTCQAYDTRELPSEVLARNRRSQNPDETNFAETSTSKIPKIKKFNLNTFKVHVLGHYALNIQQFGTSDSYSTQPGELEHRRVKKYYGRTNKNNATNQITRIERREQRLRQTIAQAPPPTANLSSILEHSAACPIERPDLNLERLPFTDPAMHHHVSKSRNTQIYLPAWLRLHRRDPAVSDFYAKLKDHLLERLLLHQYSGDEFVFTQEQRDTVVVEHHRLYSHKVVRINHTTYDVRRDQDSMKCGNHSDIMLLAHEEESEQTPHPYWYARIIGIFHASIRHTGPASKSDLPQHMVFLWVRWYGRTWEIQSGWKSRRLHAIGFLPTGETSSAAFGFVNPAEVIRGAHIIPAFHYGRTKTLLKPSIARCPADGNADWKFYYVNSFVDRDMFMRYAGGGVGHQELDFADDPLRATDLQVHFTEDIGSQPALAPDEGDCRNGELIKHIDDEALGGDDIEDDCMDDEICIDRAFASESMGYDEDLWDDELEEQYDGDEYDFGGAAL